MAHSQEFSPVSSLGNHVVQMYGNSLAMAIVGLE